MLIREIPEIVCAAAQNSSAIFATGLTPQTPFIIIVSVNCSVFFFSQSHKMAWPFLEPVNADEVPEYYDVITDPIGKAIFEK